MCALYTHVTPILYCIGLCNLFRSIWSMFSYNIMNQNKVSIVEANFFVCQNYRKVHTRAWS